MIHALPKKALPSILITAIGGFWFVACGVEENGTKPTTSTVSSSSSTTTSSGLGGMGGELLTVSSSSSSSGMGGAGGGASSSGGGSTGDLGTSCTLASDCSSGFCEDGVCCNKSCGPCLTCNQDASLGTCIALPIGTDDCPMDGKLCSKMAQCECGVSVPVNAEAPCPADSVTPSRWVSTNGTCTYTCNAMDECKIPNNVTCAPGVDCVIDCTAPNSCQGTTFNCPAGHKCTMNCADTDSCKDAVLNCSDDGPCHVECSGSGANYCKVTVNCGANSCSSNCAGGGKPIIVPKVGTVCPAMKCP